jgi:hypothetical protein
MITEINRFLNKLIGATPKAIYVTNTLAAGASVVLDVPVLLGFVAANYHVYTTYLDFKVDDPDSAANPKPVIASYFALDYSIAADGKVTLTNRHTSPVVYHGRIQTPVKQ